MTYLVLKPAVDQTECHKIFEKEGVVHFDTKEENIMTELGVTHLPGKTKAVCFLEVLAAYGFVGNRGDRLLMCKLGDCGLSAASSDVAQEAVSGTEGVCATKFDRATYKGQGTLTQ
jgi:hypothetical protein